MLAWFFWIPKTAGTSIHTRLCDDATCESEGTTGDVRILPGGTVRYLGHLTPRMVLDREIVSRAELDDAYKFCVVRHPCDRFASMLASWQWKLLCPSPSAMTEMLGNTLPRNRDNVPLFTPQHDWWRTCDDVLRYERLAEEWPRVAERIGATPTLPHTNASDHPPWQEVFSEDDVARIVAHERPTVETYYHDLL